jgi:TIR domain/Novel STAND NTPase 2
MSHEIFISYSAKDVTTAEIVCQALEKSGLSCWIAPRDITPGVKYAEAILDGINNCQLFLLILSSASNDSPQVEMEVDRAASKDITILSFRIDHVSLSKTMEFYLSSRHWLDATTPPLEKHLSILIRTVKNLFQTTPTSMKVVEKPIAVKKKLEPHPQRVEEYPVEPSIPYNPFTFGNPITEPERFYGRKQEIRQILNRLLSSAHESTSIIGERRIGKTSLLNYLSNPDLEDDLGLARDRFCPVYVDFQGLTDITPHRFWQRILGKTARSICDSDLVTAIKTLAAQDEIDLFDLEDIFDKIHDKGMIVILLMDEFEYVTQNPNFKGDFFGSLRALAIHHGVALVPATRRQLVDLCYSNELKGSPFFNIFATVILRPFSREDMDELLSGYSKLGRIAVSPDDRDFIWSMAGGYPFFAQMAGYYLVEGKMQRLSGNPLEKFVTAAFNEQSSGHYSHLWSASSDGEKNILISVLTLGMDKGMQKIPASLENLVQIRSRATLDASSLVHRGLLEEHGKTFCIFSKSFETWIFHELLAIPGEEEIADIGRGTLELRSEKLNSLQSILPHFKRKYWPALIEITNGLSNKWDPVRLLAFLS